MRTSGQRHPTCHSKLVDAPFPRQTNCRSVCRLKILCPSRIKWPQDNSRYFRHCNPAFHPAAPWFRSISIVCQLLRDSLRDEDPQRSRSPPKSPPCNSSDLDHRRLALAVRPTTTTRSLVYSSGRSRMRHGSYIFLGTLRISISSPTSTAQASFPTRVDAHASIRQRSRTHPARLRYHAQPLLHHLAPSLRQCAGRDATTVPIPGLIHRANRSWMRYCTAYPPSMV